MVFATLLRRLCLAGLLLGALAISAGAQSPANDPATASTAAPLNTPQVLYDRYVRISLPAEWRERRSWELGDDRSLPLYNPSTEAVVFVWGFDRPLYRHGYIESLATGDRLSRRLEMDLSLWPAEASRYYAMVSGGYMMKTSGHTVTVGPSLNPGQVQYLGKLKAGRAELDVVEYISDAKVDQAFAAKYKMRPELIGSQAQILFGQATFGRAPHGYTLIACRFSSQPADISWARNLLQNIEPVGKSEQGKAAAAEHVRDELSHAAAVIDDHRYGPALSQLHAVLQREPQNDNALMLQGEALLYGRKLADAEKSLRQAVSVNQNNDRAHFLLGAVLWEQKKHDQARAEWSLVQQMSPLYPQIEEVLLQRRMQRPEAATEKEP
jgi:Flp pilus assembly protein TadD